MEEEKGLSGVEKEIRSLRRRVERLEKELRLLATDMSGEGEMGTISVEGGFMDLIEVLGDLGGAREVVKEGELDLGGLLDLLTRFFFRQEAQNTQIKLLLLSQRYHFSEDVFDELNDFLRDVEDERFSISQLKFRWREIERMIREDLKKIESRDKTI
ncbi:MAG: hypothetical protein J7L88_02625 [Thermoplasmata archaeon]|nr:hypothetical protein [Thermoplasmata archaeon]